MVSEAQERGRFEGEVLTRLDKIEICQDEVRAKLHRVSNDVQAINLKIATGRGVLLAGKGFWALIGAIIGGVGVWFRIGK